MSNNTRYLELDSTFRNRNEWPDPGNFEVLISQTGSKGKRDALDPVCKSTPLAKWRSNSFGYNLGGGSVSYVSLVLDTYTVSTIRETTSLYTLILTSTSNTSKIKQITGYYNNAVLVNTTTLERRRILSYKYLGQISNSNTIDKCKIDIESPFSGDITGEQLQIRDPTDLSDSKAPLIFVPNGRLGKDAYNNYIITATNSLDETDYRVINSYDPTTCIISLDCSSNPVNPTIWSNTSNYCIRKELPFCSGVITYVSDLIYTTTYSQLPISQQNEYDYICNGISDVLETNAPTSRIKKITRVDDDITIELFEPFPYGTGDIYVDVLTFSYDNANPFDYTGSMLTQQEEVCYEIKLLNLILPNQTLQTGEGSRIAFYPYVYIQLSTVGSTGSGLKNIIYSNNPNSRNMLFRAPVTDVADPIITTHINLYGDDMAQVLKFKINESMKFSVRLQNGDIYKTVDSEQFSPYIPNPNIQITALFSFTRV